MPPYGCNGFQAAGVAAGLKKNGAKDLGLIYSENPATVAGVFTRNKVQAAPVRLDRQRIESGVARAVIVNSGNANCCTGEQGMQDALAMAKIISDSCNVAENEVLVASTGVIGEPLPLEKIMAAGTPLHTALSPEGFPDLAVAIMTTDTVPKLKQATGEMQGRPFTILGVAKGAGMINPNMATMLCFVCTDVGIERQALQKSLQLAVDQSLNRITVDEDTSTNDTVLVLANGRSGVTIASDQELALFQKALDEVLLDLARELVKDAEGATKVVQVSVRNAHSTAEARSIADTIANSPLVKTAIFGEDANWGRIIAAAGRASAASGGVILDADRIDIYFDEVQMVKNGLGCGDEAETAATAVLKKPAFDITVNLNLGDGQASVITCDFSLDYIKINADYRS